MRLHSSEERKKKLVKIGQDEGEKKAKLERRADQQRNAIERFLSQAAINQELGKSMQENWTHLEEIMNQFNDAISNLLGKKLQRRLGRFHGLIDWTQKRETL